MNDPLAFWDWFLANEERFQLLKDQQAPELLDEIEMRLAQAHPELCLVIESGLDGACEFIITAEGNPELFDDVREFVSAAPSVEGWRVVAFKPPRGFEFEVDVPTGSLPVCELWFVPLQSETHPDLLGVRFGIPGYDEWLLDDYLFACYQILDRGLGELAAFEEIDHIEVAGLPKDPQAEGFVPLGQLPDVIVWRKTRTEI